MLDALPAAIVPVILIVAIGFVWSRSGRQLDGAGTTLLIADVGTPCLIFSTLAKMAISPDAFASMALASALAILGFVAIGAGALLLLRLRLRTYLPSLAFPNTGNLGLPVALFAFGPKGLAFGVVFFAIASIANYTLGQAIAAGAANWRSILRTPILYATALGVAASTYHLALPRWLDNTVSLVGGMTVPLMLLMLGAALSKLKVSSLGRALLLSALRIGMGAGGSLAVAQLLHLEGTARLVLVLQGSMPVAVYNYLFAQRWNNDPDEVAALVLVSTLLSAVTIPCVLALLLSR